MFPLSLLCEIFSNFHGDVLLENAVFRFHWHPYVWGFPRYLTAGFSFNCSVAREHTLSDFDSFPLRLLAPRLKMWSVG